MPLRTISRRVSIAVSEKIHKVYKVDNRTNKSYLNTQMIGLFFGFLGFLSVGTAVCMDKWLVEEHLTARMGGILEKDACKRPFLMSPVKKHDKNQHKNLHNKFRQTPHIETDTVNEIDEQIHEIDDSMPQNFTAVEELPEKQIRKKGKNKADAEKTALLQILNKPVATLAGFKGLFRECLINHAGPHPGFDREKEGTNSQTQMCQGFRCECTDYWTTVHAANLDPMFITVIVMVLNGLCLLATGCVAGFYGIYRRV